jgi:hypothetical protein
MMAASLVRCLRRSATETSEKLARSEPPKPKARWRLADRGGALDAGPVQFNHGRWRVRRHDAFQIMRVLGRELLVQEQLVRLLGHGGRARPTSQRP